MFEDIDDAKLILPIDRKTEPLSESCSQDFPLDDVKLQINECSRNEFGQCDRKPFDNTSVPHHDGSMPSDGEKKSALSALWIYVKAIFRLVLFAIGALFVTSIIAKFFDAPSPRFGFVDSAEFNSYLATYSAAKDVAFCRQSIVIGLMFMHPILAAIQKTFGIFSKTARIIDGLLGCTFSLFLVIPVMSGFKYDILLGLLCLADCIFMWTVTVLAIMAKSIVLHLGKVYGAFREVDS